MPRTPREIALYTGLAIAGIGVLLLVIGPIIGDSLSPDTVLTLEPVSYAGAITLIVGLAVVTATYLVVRRSETNSSSSSQNNWSKVTQDYFDTFSHDMGRPFRRILGKEREVRARIEESGIELPESVSSLMDEIEQQAPSFRLMLENVRVLVELEDPNAKAVMEPVDPVGIVRNIADRYFALAREQGIDLSWWAEPQEFGLVYGDAAAIDHIVTNLVDNAMKFACKTIEVRVTRNPTHYYIRVWDDGAGIPESYLPHLFDRGWTPALAGRQEKSSSGLGLYIARTLCRWSGGDLAAESVPQRGGSGRGGSGSGTGEADGHYTSMTVMLPLRDRPDSGSNYANSRNRVQ